MIQTRTGNVNTHVGDKLAERLLYVLSAKGAQCQREPGAAPQDSDHHKITKR